MGTVYAKKKDGDWKPVSKAEMKRRAIKHKASPRSKINKDLMEIILNMSAPMRRELTRQHHLNGYPEYFFKPKTIPKLNVLMSRIVKRLKDKKWIKVK